MRATRTFVPALMAAAMLVPASASAAEYDSPLCFWGRPTSPRHGGINWLSADGGASYWPGRFVLPPGAEIELRGAFPHTRYMSFNIYDEQLAAVDALADIDMEADDGSTNPFLPGADRTAVARDYTARIVGGPVPSVRAPNTLYVASTSGQPSLLLYRIYIQDEGHSLTGGAGLPVVDMTLENGDVWHLTTACDPADEDNPQASGIPSQIEDAIRDRALPAGGGGYPATDPITWEKFYNLQHSIGSTYVNGTPAEAAFDDALGHDTGGYLSNADIAYASANIHRGHGPVLSLRFRAPSVPRTRDGTPVMGTGQLRYWSVCSYDRATTRVVDCVFDEDAIVDDDGRTTIVVSAPEDRPPTATAACGVSWMSWGINPGGQLILRHMLADPGFDEALQNVERPADISTVVGDYLPVGLHTTTDGFVAPGCP